MIGIIGGFLHNRAAAAGGEPQCISCQFEFLAPIYTGDRIDTVIVLDHHDGLKQLATYKIDCYNQDTDQVITGQAVMLVPGGMRVPGEPGPAEQEVNPTENNSGF
jgi:acyl dehydratase